jgi:hypothetical protein
VTEPPVDGIVFVVTKRLAVGSAADALDEDGAADFATHTTNVREAIAEPVRASKANFSGTRTALVFAP